ncbi:hypothetical protein FRC07_005964 [Ceratobasidium sp. 392]|nr:hypothetical protein FRC07_005964 [Ceratobasidium sp. 392]
MFSAIKHIFGRRDKRPAPDTRLANLDQLRNYDTQFLIDDSGSMIGPRWTEACEALMGMAKEVLTRDEDGVEVYFLNADQEGNNVKNPSDIKLLFDAVQIKPEYATPTGMRIEQVLAAYIDHLEAAKESGQSGTKPLNLIVITDGEPMDDPESVIVAAAQRLDKGQFPSTQVGIQFIQIGNDPRVKKALKELDNQLVKTHGIRNIVDTRQYSKETTLTPDALVEMLLGGISRRVDNEAKIQKASARKK